tara:strand:+ start:259 stop:507 length:249 start_codon:yes stop_codon:yes gene_type:complete
MSSITLKGLKMDTITIVNPVLEFVLKRYTINTWEKQENIISLLRKKSRNSVMLAIKLSLLKVLPCVDNLRAFPVIGINAINV